MTKETFIDEWIWKPKSGKCSNFTHNKYKGEDISEKTFEYKGCWSCEHFTYDDDFPYYDVKEASERLNVSQTTIRNWIKKGNLEGKLFVRLERKRIDGSYKKYFIKKESVEKNLNERKHPKMA